MNHILEYKQKTLESIKHLDKFENEYQDAR